MEFPAFVSALKAFYQDNDQPLRLKPKTTQADIAAAEQELGFEIDPALKAAWLAANGGPSYKPVFARQGYLTGYDFLPLQDALKQWRGLRTRAPRYAGYGQPTPRDPRIQDGWFQEGWLPFAGFSAPTLMLMLDHTPTAQGRPGQIIAFTHDPDSIDYVCVDFPPCWRRRWSRSRKIPRISWKAESVRRPLCTDGSRRLNGASLPRLEANGQVRAHAMVPRRPR